MVHVWSTEGRPSGHKLPTCQAGRLICVSPLLQLRSENPLAGWRRVMKLNWGDVARWLFIIVFVAGVITVGVLTGFGGNNGNHSPHVGPGNSRGVPGKQQPAEPPEEPPQERGGGNHGKKLDVGSPRADRAWPLACPSPCGPQRCVAG